MRPRKIFLFSAFFIVVVVGAALIFDVCANEHGHKRGTAAAATLLDYTLRKVARYYRRQGIYIF